MPVFLWLLGIVSLKFALLSIVSYSIYGTKGNIRHQKQKSLSKKRFLKLLFLLRSLLIYALGLSSIKQILVPLRLEKSGLSCGISLAEYGKINGMAMGIILFPSVIINSFSSLLIPEFSRYHATNNHKKILCMIRRIFTITILFSGFVIGIFLCFGSEIATWLYPKENISIYLIMLAPLVLVMYLDNVVDGILKGLDAQVGVMFCNIIDLAVTITFIYFFVPVLGISGYLLSIFISELLNACISLWQLIKLTHFPFSVSYFIKPAISLAFACFFTNFITVSYMENTFLSFGICILQFGIFYFGCLFLFYAKDIHTKLVGKKV